jgi:ribonuclease T1
MNSGGARLRIATACVALAAVLFCAHPVLARTAPPPIPDIAVADLPRETRDVLMMIHSGGPYRYDRDGVVFSNIEKLLPIKPKGYYHEYTVHTPGVKGRGARRIICGGPPRTPDECFYTSDHYRTYKRIRE